MTSLSSSGNRVVRLRRSSLRSSVLDDVETTRFLAKLDASPLAKRGTELEELAALRALDVAAADNYYEGTLPKMKKKALAAAEAKSMDERITVETDFYKLMNLGFERRLASERALANGIDASPRDSRFLPLQNAAQYAERRLELGKSKDEQLRDLKKQRLAQRSGIMKMVPQPLHKYVDYLRSLQIKPSSSEVTKNVLFGAFFSFITWVNQLRNAYMFYVVGHLIVLSSLLTRNMPPQVVSGVGKNRRVTSWSRNAFQSAAAITILFSLAASSVVGLATSVLPLPLIAKVKIIMVSSLISTSYFASFYEVYEEKSKNGWRWKKALEGNTLSAEDQAKLAEQVFGDNGNLNDMYTNNYDPEIDDYPPLPKYLDELDGAEPTTQGGSGELDEGEAREHFEAWKIVRKEARRPPIEDAPPETPWVGSKEGMYVKNIPGWLNSAYQKNVLGANAWRGKPTKFVKDTSEFEPIPGPFGFRDKRPQWLEIFGAGVWEEKVQASRRAARAFGSYRKSMFKVDKEVVLRPCDGVEL